MKNVQKKDFVLLVSPISPPIGGIASWTENFFEKMNNHENIILLNTSKICVSEFFLKFESLFNVFKVLKLFIQMVLLLITKSIIGAHISTSLSPLGIKRDKIFIKILKFFKCPIIMHVHCTIPDISNIYDNKDKIVELLKLATHVVTLNKISREFVLDYCHTSTSIIPNYYENSNEYNKIYAKKIKNVLFVGHITIYKGVREYIDAAKLNPEIDFHIAGEVIEPELLNEIPINVKYQGVLSKVGINNLYKKADVFILPSYTEGFPISLLEAMSFGLPIITTNVGANVEMIGSNGGIITDISGASIHDAIQKLSDTEIRKKTGVYNFKRLNNNYNSEKIIKTWCVTYERFFRGEH
jgi:L-malate glycosyltransferase